MKIDAGMMKSSEDAEMTGQSAGMMEMAVLIAEAAIQNLKIFEIKMAKCIVNISTITCI